MVSLPLLPSSPAFTLSTPSLLPSPTLLGGDYPPISLSRPLSHQVTMMTFSGSRIGLFLGSSILPKVLPSVPYSTISHGTFRSKHFSFSGCNFPHSTSVPIIIPFFYTHRYFTRQGAQTTYYNVLRPVLANVSHRTGSTRTLSNDTVTAEGLRDRVATATSAD